MAIIACADCHREISDQAASCPHCGAPRKPALVTTQLTGKAFKALKFIALVLSIFGAVVLVISEARMTGAWMLLIGLLLFAAARMGAWWHSG